MRFCHLSLRRKVFSDSCCQNWSFPAKLRRLSCFTTADGTKERISAPVLMSSLNLELLSSNKWSIKGMATLTRWCDSGFTLGALFLCSCLPVILGTETVAPILSASLDASSNYSAWHSAFSMFDLTLATGLIVSSTIEYAWKISWSFFWSVAAIGLSVPRLIFVIKKVKMNPTVFKFARRPCALV